MKTETRNRIALIAAATVLPGGWLLGAVALAHHYRKRASEGWQLALFMLSVR